MKGFGFKQLKRKEGPSFYLSGFKEKRKRTYTSKNLESNGTELSTSSSDRDPSEIGVSMKCDIIEDTHNHSTLGGGSQPNPSNRYAALFNDVISMV